MKDKLPLLTLPFILFAGIFIIAGALKGLIQGFGYAPAFGLSKFTLHYFTEVFRDPYFFSSLRWTLYLAAVSAVLSACLGFAVALCIYKLMSKNKALYFLYQTPIMIPHIVACYIIFFLFMQTGFVSRILNFFHVMRSDSFPLLVFDRAGAGIILVYLFKQIPFVTLYLVHYFENLCEDYICCAKNLGANFRQCVLHVILPLSAPALASVTLFNFVFDFGCFEVPMILGSPAEPTLPQKAYIEYLNPDFSQRGYAAAANTLITFLMLIAVALYLSCAAARKRKTP